ncbi:hypothetical protein NHJ13734_009908 [Beauveria thailandica]
MTGSFINCATTGLRLISAVSPSSTLLGVNALNADSSYVDTPEDLPIMQLHSHDAGSPHEQPQYYVNTTNWVDCVEFGIVSTVITPPWVGSSELRLQSISMQPAEAADLMRAAGYDRSFNSFGLFKPVIPDAEVQYVFTVGKHECVIVNTKTMAVTFQGC